MLNFQRYLTKQALRSHWPFLPDLPSHGPNISLHANYQHRFILLATPRGQSAASPPAIYSIMLLIKEPSDGSKCPTSPTHYSQTRLLHISFRLKIEIDISQGKITLGDINIVPAWNFHVDLTFSSTFFPCIFLKNIE